MHDERVRIAVVDDDRDSASALRLLLGSRYGLVSVAESREELIDLVSAESPDAVVAGTRHLGRDAGWIGEVRRAAPHSTIVAYSALVRARDADAARRNGADAVVERWSDPLADLAGPLDAVAAFRHHN